MLSRSAAFRALTIPREGSRKRRSASRALPVGNRIARLAEALDRKPETANPYPPAAIKLLLLTGCRKSEITNLRWDHVDFERECLRLPDSKTGAKVVYLNAPARAVLHELPQLADNSRVIPGMRADSAIAAIENVWSRVRKAAGLADVRLHDLRHSFASVGAAGGLSLPIIGALLGHKQRRPRPATRICRPIRCVLRTMWSVPGSRLR